MARLCPFEAEQVVYHISIYSWNHTVSEKKIRRIRHYEDYDYFEFYDGTHSFSWSIGNTLFSSKKEAEEASRKMQEGKR